MKPQELKSALDAFIENKVAPLDIKHKAAICAAALILPIIAFVFLVYSPKTEEIQKLESQQAKIEQQIKS